MDIPRKPSSNLTPGQILAYTAAALLIITAIIVAAIVVPPLAILFLTLVGLATLAGLVWFGVALYNDHADRRAQRERLKPGELVQFRRDDKTVIIVDPSRSAVPAFAVTDGTLTPLLPVDEAQIARNVQSAAIQLAQAAPTSRTNWDGMIEARRAPVVITEPAPTPQLAPPDAPSLADMRVNLVDRLSGDADALLLGVDAHGAEIRTDLHSLMHTGLLAATGGGKTTTMSSIALQLASDPSVNLVIADPHMMELSLLEDTGALHYPMPQNARQAVQQLEAIAREIHRRAELVNAVSAQIKDIKGRREILHRLDRYNRAATHVGAERLPALVAFADEIPALAAMGPEAENALRTITSEGRKFGVYFVGASQSWKASVINTDVKNQFWSRVILPGAPVRQVAELFEIEQAEARKLTDQLTAPGIAALWRRGADTMLLKTPYIDLESDRVYRVIEGIAEQRRTAQWGEQTLTTTHRTSGGNTSGNRSHPFTETPETFREAETYFSGWESDVSQFPDLAIDAEKREKVLQMRENGKGKLEILREVWGATSGRKYQAASAEYEAMLESMQ